MTISLISSHPLLIPFQYYKLNDEAAIKALNADIPNQHALIDNIIVSAVAMKSVMG